MIRAVFLFLYIVVSSPVLGQDLVVSVSQKDTIIDVKPFALVFADRTNALPFDSILSQAYTPLPEIFCTQDTHVFWVKLRIKSALSVPSEWRIHLYPYWCDSVDIYSTKVGASENWLHQRAGNLCPIEALDQNSGILNQAKKTPNEVSIRLESGDEKLFFIRYKNRYRQYLSIHPSLKPMMVAANQVADYERDMFITIAFVSALWVLALYHLLFFFMVRDIAYFYYALYGFSAPLAITIMDTYNNIQYQVFFKNIPEVHPWYFINLGTLAVIFYILFTRSFLQTKTRFPRLDKAILLLLLLTSGSSIVVNINFTLTQRQYLPGMPFEGLIVLVSIVFGILLSSIWKTKRVTEIFYLFGVGGILLTIVPKYFFFLFHEPYEKMWFDWLYPGIMYLGLIFELLLFAVGLGYRTRQTQLEKQRYAELDALKSRFFANISHEFRTPLTLIIGPLMQVKETLQDAKSKQLLQVVEKNAKRLLHLINQVLDLTKLEAKKMRLRASYRDIIPHLKGILYSYESLARQKNIELTIKCSNEALSMYYDAEKMETILYNLLTNALKYTPDGGQIRVQVQDKNEKLELRIQDTGKGIPGDRLPKIFDRFFQAENNQDTPVEGTGIGLAIVKELVLLHRGSIRVESEVGLGTLFILEFPMGKDHLQQDEMVLTSTSGAHKHFAEMSALETDHTSGYETTQTQKSAPLVLLIEDNFEVRGYIRQCLEGKYQIIEAVDGAEGIKKAIKHSPELIISDVMMPKKNGYEVCKTIKTDIRTSHIPIILLTARAAQEEKLEGLETGADDYLLKPFESSELIIRVLNLIRLRQQLRERFAVAISLKPNEVVSTSLDKIFLEKALQTVESNLQNEQFSVESLAFELNMSKPHLNRKLQALLHQSSNQFIQSIRLQRAAQLLQDQAGTVSEIAFQTGFSGTAYFVKCFKEHFGETPGQFVKKKR